MNDESHAEVTFDGHDPRGVPVMSEWACAFARVALGQALRRAMDARDDEAVVNLIAMREELEG